VAVPPFSSPAAALCRAADSSAKQSKAKHTGQPKRNHFPTGLGKRLLWHQENEEADKNNINA
jgi:hypothetical protein